jgi:hypothetical protein
MVFGERIDLAFVRRQIPNLRESADVIDGTWHVALPISFAVDELQRFDERLNRGSSV